MAHHDNSGLVFTGIIGEEVRKMSIVENRRITEATFLGAAVGDALGVPYEFLTREEVRKVFVSEMVGETTGTGFVSQWSNFIPNGAFSDDTSMLIAAASAIAEKDGEIDWRGIMQNFSDWWLKGEFCSLDFPFGMGRTVGDALQRFDWGREPLDCGGTMVRDNGNGALMRILPFSLYAIFREMNRKETAAFIADASRMTHGHEISFMGCYIFTIFLQECLKSRDKDLALARIRAEDYSDLYASTTIAEYSLMLESPCSKWDETQVRESGYVADTLLGALFSIMKSGSFEETVCTAVRLGGDTDTVACVAGQLAGALYGKEGIPQGWLDDLRKREELIALATRFADSVTPAAPENEAPVSASGSLRYAWGMRPGEAATARLAERLAIGTVDSGSSLFGPLRKRNYDRNKLTLVIGLGGSGLIVAEKTKRLLDRELSTAYGDRVSFIGVDVSSKELTSWKSLGSPVLDLTPPEFRRSIFPAGKKDFFREFVPDNYCEYSLYRSRLTSRILLYNWNGERTGDGALRGMIESLFLNEWADYSGLPVDIVVISGLSGNMGSGIFIDVAARARHACPEGASVRVFGCFLMPEAAEKHASTRAIRNSMYRNTFAALKELGSFLSMEMEPERREYFPSQEPGGDLILSGGERLFDYPIFISGDLDQASDTVAETIAHSVTEAEGALHLRSLWANSHAARMGAVSGKAMFAEGHLLTDACLEDPHAGFAIGFTRASIPALVVIPNLIGRVMRKMYTCPGFPSAQDERLAAFVVLFESMMEFYTEAGSSLDDETGQRFLCEHGEPNTVNFCCDRAAIRWVRDRIAGKVRSIDIPSARKALLDEYLSNPEAWTSDEPGLVRRMFDEAMGRICGLGSCAGTADGLGLTMTDYFREMSGDLPAREAEIRIDRYVTGIMMQLYHAGGPGSLLAPGRKGLVSRVIFIPDRLAAGPFGNTVLNAVRQHMGDSDTLVLSPDTEDMACFVSETAIPLADLDNLDLWEDAYETSATATMHRSNGELARLHMETGFPQFKELTWSGTCRLRGKGLGESLGGEEERVFGTGLSWLHYPSVNLRRYRDTASFRPVTTESRYRCEVFDRKIEAALALKIIECERCGDRYKYYLNSIPDDWTDLSVENYLVKDPAGLCARGKELFDYLRTRNSGSVKPCRRQIALYGCPSFGPEGFDFSEVAPLADWPEDRITETHRSLMKRILRRATGLYQTLEDTLYRYYEVETALRERDKLLTKGKTAERFVTFYLSGVINPDDDLYEWTVQTGPDAATDLITFSRRFRASMDDLQRKLFGDGLRLAIVYDRYCAMLDDGIVTEESLGRIRDAVSMKMSDREYDRMLDERLAVLAEEMKAFTDRLGGDEIRTETILEGYEQDKRRSLAAERIACLYQAVGKVLREQFL